MPGFTPTQLKAYAATWKKWWCTLQPQWRNISSWPPSTAAIGPDADWSALSVGGPNGIFLPLMALSWWVGAANGMNDESLQGAVDMTRTFELMIAAHVQKHSAVLGKRKGSVGVCSASSSKRRVT